MSNNDMANILGYWYPKFRCQHGRWIMHRSHMSGTVRMKRVLQSAEKRKDFAEWQRQRSSRNS